MARPERGRRRREAPPRPRRRPRRARDGDRGVRHRIRGSQRARLRAASRGGADRSPGRAEGGVAPGRPRRARSGRDADRVTVPERPPRPAGAGCRRIAASIVGVSPDRGEHRSNAYTCMTSAGARPAASRRPMTRIGRSTWWKWSGPRHRGGRGRPRQSRRRRSGSVPRRGVRIGRRSPGTCAGDESRFSRLNRRCRSADTSSARPVSRMAPSNARGRRADRSWGHLPAARARAKARDHWVGGESRRFADQLARATRNVGMNTSRTSRRTECWRASTGKRLPSPPECRRRSSRGDPASGDPPC